MAQGNKVIKIAPAPGTGSAGIKDVTYDNATNVLTVTDGGGGVTTYTLEDQHLKDVTIVGHKMRFHMAPDSHNPTGKFIDVDLDHMQADWDATSGVSQIKNQPHETEFQGDWLETDQTKMAFIKNKPGQTTIPQSDWTELDNTRTEFIKNKPTAVYYQANWKEVLHTSQHFIQNKPRDATMTFHNHILRYVSSNDQTPDTLINLAGYENNARTVAGQYLHHLKQLELVRDDSSRFTIDVTGLDGDGKFIPIAEKGVAGGVATLGTDGKLPNSQVPPLAINDIYHVATVNDLYTLDAGAAAVNGGIHRGDMAIVTATGQTMVANTDKGIGAASWTEIKSNGGSVQSDWNATDSTKPEFIQNKPKITEESEFNGAATKDQKVFIFTHDPLLLDVYLDGIKQNPQAGVIYTSNGTTVTFKTPLHLDTWVNLVTMKDA